MQKSESKREGFEEQYYKKPKFQEKFTSKGQPRNRPVTPHVKSLAKKYWNVTKLFLQATKNWLKSTLASRNGNIYTPPITRNLIVMKKMLLQVLKM